MPEADLTLRHTPRPIAADLWVVEQPLSALGGRIQVGRRMTVVRLRSGALFLHSVARLTAPLREALDALGPVRFVVSPNALHHYFMEQYAEAYPRAELLASPGLARKRPDLDFAGRLDGRPDPRWADDLDQLVFEGLRLMREVVFLHRASRTLILTDLCQRFEPPASRGTRWWGRLNGTWEHFATARGVRWSVKDRAAARASAERILAWDFDRVIIAHGRGVETGAKAAVRAAFGWLLESSRSSAAQATSNSIA